MEVLAGPPAGAARNFDIFVKFRGILMIPGAQLRRNFVATSGATSSNLRRNFAGHAGRLIFLMAGTWDLRTKPSVEAPASCARISAWREA